MCLLWPQHAVCTRAPATTHTTCHFVCSAASFYLLHFCIIHIVGVYNGSKPFSVRYVLNLLMITCTVLAVSERWSEAFQCLFGWLRGWRASGPIPRRGSASLVQICVRGQTGNNSTRGEGVGIEREREWERERELSDGSSSYTEGCGGLHLRWEWPRVTQPAECVLI